MAESHDRRAERTRARLLAAGARAFGEKGLASVHLKRDILEPAQVSVGSFYHQFADKTELLLAIMARHSEAQRRQFSEVHRPDANRTGEEIARLSFGLVFDLADASPDALNIQLRQRADEDPRISEFIDRDRLLWRRSLANDFEGLNEAFGSSLEVELAAELMDMLILGAIERYMATPESERPKARERILDGLVQLTLRGMPGLASKAPPPNKETT
jgi:AcrR family transcriptional regulator